MGEVWKAFDSQLKRFVAIKLLRPNHQNDADFLIRFTQEAQLIATLSHPHIVKIHNFYSEENPPLCYMVMDLIEGFTLADYIRGTSRAGIFPAPADVLYIFTAVALALDYAHQHNMIHRDIKPANILLDQRLPAERALGRPVLTDFGIARRLDNPSGTAVGSILGTPTYIAPEQAQGRVSDPRSDLYSLGIILYEMMAGRPPFTGNSSLMVMSRHIQEQPAAPEIFNPAISPALSSLILRTIAKNPDDRFPSAPALVLALADAFNLPVPTALTRSTGTPTAQLPQSESPTNTPIGAYPPIAITTPPISHTSHVHRIQSLPIPHQQPISSQYPIPQAKQALPSPHIPQTPHITFTKNSLLLLSIALLIITGSILGSLFLFHSANTRTTDIVGKVTFSKQAGSSNYSSLHIDIEQIDALPAGKAYYAWVLMQGEDESPHWQLAVKQHAIHMGPLTFANTSNLLIPDSLFLITQERTDSPPIVPDTNPEARLYYARIPPSPSPALELRRCPSVENALLCI
jgi:serine/threonine protein kinase